MCDEEDEGSEYFDYNDDKLHRMALRYRKISSQIIQIYLDSCHYGEQHVIQSMIQENALTEHVVNFRDSNGRTGLSYACEYGYEDIVRTLARCDNQIVDPNIADKEGNSCLMYAAQAGNDLCVSVLLDYFPDLDIDHTNFCGINALMKSAIQGNSECARLLILSGASPFMTDHRRIFTAEKWAAYCGRNSTADLIRRLRVTLGPKLCALCGYTKPLANCPGHGGVCKNHTPSSSTIDIANQKTSTDFVKHPVNRSSSKPRHPLVPCQLFVQCPSGNYIDLPPPSTPPQGKEASNWLHHPDTCSFPSTVSLASSGNSAGQKDETSANNCPSVHSSPLRKHSSNTSLRQTTPVQRKKNAANNNRVSSNGTATQKKARFSILNICSCLCVGKDRSATLSENESDQNERRSSLSKKRSAAASNESLKRKSSYTRYSNVSRRISVTSA